MAQITVKDFLSLAQNEFSELSIYDYYTGKTETFSVRDLLESDSHEDIKKATIDTWEYDTLKILLLINIDTTDQHCGDEG